MKNQTSRTVSELRIVTSYRAALLLALFVFLFVFTVTSVFARSLQQQNDQDFSAKVKQQAMILESELSTHANRYKQLLLHATSLFAVKSDVTRADWETFYTVSDIKATYPVLIGIGYAPVVAGDDVSSFEEAARADGVGDITIAPQADRSIATPVFYVEPLTTENQVAVGYDMSSDTVRRAAMDRARDNAEAVMTAPVSLSQNQGTLGGPMGVLIYYPVYTTPTVPATLEARRASIRAYVFVVLHPNDLVKAYLDSHMDEYAQTGVMVQDVTDPMHAIEIFSSTPEPVPIGPAVTDAEVGEISDRTWAITTTGWSPVVQRSSPFVVFVLGTVVSLALAWMIYRVMIGRMKHIASTFEGEMQRTKDELLALASHQLRTPASGVKQYLGMLTSGMLGRLTHDQQSVAQKAFEANERQLEIINELLYVSKADAGQLVIEPKTFDLTRVVWRVVDGLAEQAAHKDITIVFSTKRTYRVTADDRYISMAIENLISNSIKYSYPSSTVHLKITASKDDVALSIRDHGVGVADTDAEHIFGKFNRVDNPLSHAEGGSGLGLFLARQLARAHGGDITVRSNPGKGSTFTMTLPKVLTINEAIVNLERIKRNEGSTHE